MKTEVTETDVLNALDNEDLDYVSLGLEHNFGCVLCGNAGESDFHLRLESGRIVALDEKTITVGDVWKVAEALTR